MANDFYTPTGWPVFNTTGLSQDARDEIALIDAGFAKLPALTGNADKVAQVNAGATAIEAITASAARTALSLVIGTDAQAWDQTLQWYVDNGPYANAIPIYDVSGNDLNYLTFRDEDNMSSADATGLASQQSIKAYTDSQVSAVSALFTAPLGQDMVFYNTAAPTGWAVVANTYDNHAMFIAQSSTAKFGGRNPGSTYASPGPSGAHTHNYDTVVSVTTSSNGSYEATGAAGGFATETAVPHDHDFGPVSGTTTGTYTDSHGHFVSAALYTICLICEKTT